MQLDFDALCAEIDAGQSSLLDLLTPKQLAIELDPSFLRAIFGARQWGKTTWSAAAHKGASIPGAVSLAIAPTVTKARDLLLPGVEWLNGACGAGIKFHGGDFRFIMPDGGAVQCMGMGTVREAEKIRGYTPPFITIEECFVSSTIVHPVGRITGHIARQAPNRLVSVDAVVSTPDHPYLTPEGWKRAEEIVPGDLLCVWEPVSDALSETAASNVFQGVPLRALLENTDGARDSKSAAAAFCKRSGATRRGDIRAANCLRSEVLTDDEGYRPSAESARRQRPWAHIAGIPAAECDWLTRIRGADRGSHQRRSANQLQVGPGRAISEAGDRNRWPESQHVRAESTGCPQGCMARWARVDRVEIHERGGTGRYDEVCPDGLVHDIQTESGVFFAGGRLVSNCGTYKPELLKFAIESCATPSQIKWYRNGGRGVAMIGTPGLTENDYWHQQCKGEFGASVHRGTVFDNPYIKFPNEYLEDILAKNKWSRTTPRFRREYLGEFCSESDSMCYTWDKIVLPQHAAPDGGTTFMGIDLGATRSPSAWVVVRITRELQDKQWRWIIHVIHSESAMTATVHDVVAKTAALKKRFGVTRMRGDSAGMGAMTLDTMSQKFQGVHVEHAPKAKQKLERIWLMSSMLQTGSMRIYEGARSLGDQMLAVPWNDDKDDHHPSYPDHECDAAQYVVELANQWTKEQLPAGPEPGSKEFRLREMAKYKQEAINRGDRESD